VAAKRLSFDSNPPGAEVITETGERWGVTPFTRMQPAESPAARVVIRLPGHEDQTVQVLAGESMTFNVQLRPLAAPTAVLAPGVGTPDGITPPETPSTEPGASKPTTSTRPKTAPKTKTGAGSKPEPTPGETKPAPEKPPAEEPPAPKPPEEDELDMGDLKNPFRKK
jgi:hypothetical protein